MFMHCSLCGYKSKCPLAMEKHRIDRHLVRFKHERLRVLTPMSMSVSESCRIDTILTSRTSSLSFDNTNSVVSSMDEESVTDSSSIFSRDFSKTSCDTMDVDDKSADSPLIDVIGPYGPFSEVSSFRVGTVTNHSIQLRWRRPIDIGTEILQNYQIQFSKYNSLGSIPVSS